MFPGPSLQGRCEGLFLGILLHSLQMKKPFSHSLGLGSLKVTLPVPLGSSRSAAPFPG